MYHTAGSCGDPRAPQFIVENRALSLDYARDDQIRDSSARPHAGAGGAGSSNSRGGTSAGVKTDWLCDSVGSYIFIIFKFKKNENVLFYGPNMYLINILCLMHLCMYYYFCSVVAKISQDAWNVIDVPPRNQALRSLFPSAAIQSCLLTRCE